MAQIFNSGVNGFSPYFFYNQKQEAATVQRRKRYEIKNCQIKRQDYGKLQNINKSKLHDHAGINSDSNRSGNIRRNSFTRKKAGKKIVITVKNGDYQRNSVVKSFDN